MKALARPDYPGAPTMDRPAARTNWAALLAIAAASLAIRLVADVVVDPPTFGDESPVGLMARHILLQGERPVFYYGQAYLGSLQAYVAALFFALFGPSTASLRLAPLLAWSAHIVLTGWLAGKMVSARMAIVAALLAALAPPVVLFTAHLALGGIGAEVLLSGTAQLALAYHIARSPAPPGRRHLFALGLLFGFSLWVHFLTGVYALAALTYILLSYVRRWRALSPLCWLTPLGIFVGLAPALLWNAANGWQSLSFLKSALRGELARAPDDPGLPGRLVDIARDGVTGALGARNDWDGWIALPWTEQLPMLSGAVVAFYLVALLWWLVARRRAAGCATARPIDLVMLVAGWNLLLFVPIPLQDEGPVLRYLLPLSGVLPIIAAWLGDRLL